jgi:hypothetical protein
MRMSKPQISVRVPKNIRDAIDEYREREGIDDRAEAARQVMRQGLDASNRNDSAGEQLGRISTSVAAVGTVVAAIAALLGQPWAVPLLVPFGAGMFFFAVLWASIRVLEGRDLV